MCCERGIATELCSKTATSSPGPKPEIFVVEVSPRSRTDSCRGPHPCITTSLFAYSSDRSPTGDDDARIIRIAAAAAAAVNDGSEGAVRPPVILRHGAE